VGGFFTLHELVRVDLSNETAISRAETNHLLQALGAYVVIVLITSIPLLMRWLGGRGRSRARIHPAKRRTRLFNTVDPPVIMNTVS
jgi:hypothetical protein